VFENLIYVLGLMLIFVSILFLTYITTKYIGRNAGKVAKGKHLHIIETICLGKDKYLYLIKAGNDHILVSSSNKGIDMLGNIDMDIDVSVETAVERTEQEFPLGSFKGVFGKYLNQNFSRYNKQKVDKEYSNNAKDN